MQEQLNQIIHICNQGQDVTNFQVRSILSSLAQNIKRLAYLSIPQQTSDIINSSRSYVVQQCFDQQINSIKQLFAKKYNIFQQLQQKMQKIHHINKEQIQQTLVKIQNAQNDFQKNIKIEMGNHGQRIKQVRILAQEHATKLAMNYDQLAKVCEIQGRDLIYITKCFYNLEEKIDSLQDQIGYLKKPRKMLKLQMGEQFQEEDNKIQMFDEFKLKALERSFIRVYDWIDLQCQGLKYIGISNNNQIKAKSWANIIGKPIQKSIFSFEVKINKMRQAMGLGFVDFNYRYQKSLVNLTNRIWYTSSKICFDGQKKSQGCGNGFNEGDQISVTIDTVKGTVEWKVKDGLKYAIKCPLIMKRQVNINWAPYIWLQHQHDSITLIR